MGPVTFSFYDFFDYENSVSCVSIDFLMGYIYGHVN